MYVHTLSGISHLIILLFIDNTDENAPVYVHESTGEFANITIPPLLLTGPSGVGKSTLIQSMLYSSSDLL
jgi:DNA replication protein DnaC